MKLLRIMVPAALLSLFFNNLILFSVVLNLDWVRSRAAGGQFESFPIAIRIIYFVMFVIIIALIIWLWDHRKGKLNSKSAKLAQYVGYVFILSTITQLISRSADERWNAIPAVIIAITFFQLAKQKS